MMRFAAGFVSGLLVAILAFAIYLPHTPNSSQVLLPLPANSSEYRSKSGSTAKAKHVLIAYPEHWNDGDRRPCFLGPAGGSTVSPAFRSPDLPQLDCDRFVQGEVIHRTPPERIFAIDVSFEGDFPTALSGKATPAESLLTCQKVGDAITCKP
jgi:hypothetical protein